MIVRRLRHRQSLAAAILALLTLLPATPSSGEDVGASDPGLSRQLAERLRSPTPLIVEGIVLDRGMLAAAYGARADAPVWTDHPDWVGALVATIASAPEQGIPAESIDLANLQRALADPRIGAADRELLLTDRYIAYGAMLGRGRLAMASVEADWILPAPAFEPLSTMALLEQAGGPAAALQILAPASPDYRRLQKALARYAGMAAAGGWESLPLGTDLKAPAESALVSLLRRRLVAEGELAPDLAAGDLFDAPVEAAVRNFQRRHGLLVDGHVGPATLAALNITASDRVRQIQTNLERLRAMPRSWPGDRIEAQTAFQTLTLYRDDKQTLASRVIVGAPNHPTPVLAAEVQRVVLNPPWDVPASIVRREIQPRLRRDPSYLARNHFVILGRDGGDAAGQDLDWRQTDVLAMGWRLRQLPGPWNALGSVMLDMPNPFDVYLHDTPGRNLFALPQRALSHGCVRVEAARDLAAAVLGAPLPPPGGATRGIPLATPLPVFFLYQTARVDEDGTVEFRDDIYGRDARLAAALAVLDSGATIAPAAVASARSCPEIAANLAALAR